MIASLGLLASRLQLDPANALQPNKTAKRFVVHRDLTTPAT
jgi:hypothetical protein